MAQLVPAGRAVLEALQARRGRVRETTPEKRAPDLADVAAFEEYKRLSRKYFRLRTDELWALVGKSDDEIAEIMNRKESVESGADRHFEEEA